MSDGTAERRVMPVTGLAAPKFRNPWIEPPALRQGLAMLRAHRVVLITALPGSGKSHFMTRLASEAQAALDITAWLRCTSGSGADIVTGIATTLVRSLLGERSATAAMLMAPGSVPASLLLTMCLNEVATFAGEVVLFLDDLGTLDDEGAWAMVQQLIEQAPDNLRVVMASRRAVPLKLSRLINDGTLLKLETRDLQLDSGQIADLLASLGRPTPDLAELRTLSEQTSGWVGGLLLLTRRDPDRRSKGRGIVLTASMLDYFGEEVLAGLSSGARNALDLILTPHLMRESLIFELAGDADFTPHLRELQDHCLLEAVHGQGGTTYHPAPLLPLVVRQLRRIGEHEALRLHRHCSSWFELHGEPQAAAAHAVDAGDLDRAVQLIDRCGMAMIAEGHITALQGWMTHLPIERLRKRPWALLSVAWALSLLYRLDDALPLIAAVEEDLAVADDETLEASVAALKVMHRSMRDDMAGSVESARVWIARFGRREDWSTYVVDNSLSFALAHVGQVNEARLVLERAYLPNFYARGPYAAIYSRCILGLIDLRDGQVRRAEANFAWALKAAETDAGGNSTGAVMSAGLLAGVRYERNDMAGSQRLLGGYAWWMHGHLFTDARFQAYRAIARGQLRRHQYRAAISTLEQVLDSGPAVRLLRLHADVLVEKIHIALAQHDLRMVNTYIAALAEQLRGADDPVIARYVEASLAGSRARLHIALGGWSEAMAMLRQAIRLDLNGGWKLRAFTWAVLLAVVLSRSGREDDAVRLMGRLVGHAARAGIVSSFLDGGPDAARLLDRLAEASAVMDRRKQTHLRRLREAFDPSLAETDAAEVEPADSRDALTTRELELIRLVKAGLTNRQIAERMQVSENTIKWHLKNVFEKVSVRKRTELAGLALPTSSAALPARPPANRVVSRRRRPASVLPAGRE
ncbi:LuxR C-terminal-related transcriptional regulator [Rhizorhabdus phycosphaerae]|uniref:LuxR C-terminal-related transcriptional regulator n=1 Tax=Rhizorhabdus phycosphaerae TaxID=2711156 RepID=UPI0013ED9180|nr:LuxR C-terminal-related transcriptional regulator [Rhizorhabdus phycosphaerae]